MTLIRRSLAVLALLACSSYSYSEEVFGSTQNAASAGLNWVMTNVLPQQAGLTVNGVVYRYTAVKDPATGMIVYVQNENAQGNGYIFREADDWSGLPGNTINKVVPVDNIPRELWGDGSIQVDGDGIVTDASVIYTYQYDTCFDPQTSPECPGYKDPIDPLLVNVEIVDPLDDDLIQDELDRKATLRDEDQEDRDRKKLKESEKEEGESLEQILGIVNDTLLAAESQALAAELVALSMIPQTYYVALPGGEIKDAAPLTDRELPKNNRARRLGFAQQLLHEELVRSQYNKK